MLHNLRIVDYVIGVPGSLHDSTLFLHARIYRHPQAFLGANEWIWADTAYPSLTWCVVPFKKPSGRELAVDLKFFNYHLSSVSSIFWSVAGYQDFSRFVSVLNIFLVHSRAGFNPFENCAFKFKIKLILITQICGSVAASFYTIWLSTLKKSLDCWPQLTCTLLKHRDGGNLSFMVTSLKLLKMMMSMLDHLDKYSVTV